MNIHLSLSRSMVVLCLCLISFTAAAQDSLYYMSAFNKQGDSLKYELHVLIKNHTEFKYTSSSSTDVWDILKVTDRDTVNPDNVILIYSGRSVNGPQEYNGGQGWTREHVWAKSRGDFGTSEGPGTDVHHLRPCDNSMNSTRNNRNFDNCNDCVDVYDEGVNTGSKKDQNQWTFEPRDDVKGDVARMIFYMAVRYEGTNGEPDLELTNTHLSKTDKSSFQGNYETLIQWHIDDPVSNWERNRNQIIYDQYQHNRNPFIDYPELASYLWGADTAKTWMSTDTGSTLSLKPTITLPTVSFYPNPAQYKLSFDITLPEVIVYNSHGGIVLKARNKNAILIGHLPKGVYFIKADGFATSSFIKQ